MAKQFSGAERTLFDVLHEHFLRSGEWPTESVADGEMYRRGFELGAALQTLSAHSPTGGRYVRRTSTSAGTRWSLTLEGISHAKRRNESLTAFLEGLAFCAAKAQEQTLAGDDGPCTVAESEVYAALRKRGHDDSCAARVFVLLEMAPGAWNGWGTHGDPPAWWFGVNKQGIRKFLGVRTWEDYCSKVPTYPDELPWEMNVPVSIGNGGLVVETAPLSVDEAETLRNSLIAYATSGNGGIDTKAYLEGRKRVLADVRLKDLAPRFLRTCRTLQDYWAWIKGEESTYAARRKLLREAFEPMLHFLDDESTGIPMDAAASEGIAALGEQEVMRAWERALARRESDPEGAITAARTLMESTCKHILDARGIAYVEKDDIAQLYSKTAKSLNLAPSQHTEETFKRILGGCHSVVEGLGSLRNSMSDAHGSGRRVIRTQPRHAQLAVNLSGAMSAFLVATHLSEKGKP